MQSPVLPRKITIVGATGKVGRALVSQLLQHPQYSNVPIQLAGGRDRNALWGMMQDLQEATLIQGKRIRVTAALDLSEIDGDLVIMAGGATVDPQKPSMTRADLAAMNRPVFEDLAQVLKSSSSPRWIIVVSNPHELAMKVLSTAAQDDNHSTNIVGMGSVLDSYRFRLGIQEDILGATRVEAMAGGEHGPNLVPFWSTVRFNGQRPSPSVMQRLTAPPQRVETVGQLVDRFKGTDTRSGVVEAYVALLAQGPERHAVLEPPINHTLGGGTSIATAAATVKLINMVLSGNKTVAVAHIVDKDGIPVGLPVEMGQGSVIKLDPKDILSRAELQRIDEAKKAISKTLTP